MVKTDLSIAIPNGCYGRIAPWSGLAVKKFIDIGAGVIDADYRGEIGVVMFNHSDEDLKVKQGDHIAQLILEKISTLEVKEIVDLSFTIRDSQGFGNLGLEKIAVLLRVQGKPKLKQTNACRIQCEFVYMRKMKKLMKQKEDVFLCIVKAEKMIIERKRRSRGGKKMESVETTLSNIIAQDSHETTEKTKREHNKVVGPKRFSRRLKKGLKKSL